jgi:hypothetical protein
MSVTDWWEEEAKPFFRSFCKRFSIRTHRLRERRCFLKFSLKLALEASDWPRGEGNLAEAMEREQRIGRFGQECCLPWVRRVRSFT